VTGTGDQARAGGNLLRGLGSRLKPFANDPAVRIWLRVFGFGILYLVFGAFVFCHALFDQWTYNEILQHGVGATADASNIRLNRSYYTSDLAWLDKSEQSRTYKTPLSVEFVDSLRNRGFLARHDIDIKYLEENAFARPLVIGDEREREGIVSNDLRWGIGLFLSSLVLIALMIFFRPKSMRKPA